MPTYTYACERCGEFERVQDMSAPALETCPECGAPVRRLLTPGSGHIIKGRGREAHCGSPSPCCGRAERCDKPPCGK
ncbi:MAG: zinc ribbon domain-containing protein [Deltaproteobacteria bacterium]|nr:zinc ribbon domain-containing protein [Deltaproteobacteria bacterium]